MKDEKKMLKPEIEFIEFDTADVITTSGDPMDGVKNQESTDGYSNVTPLSGDTGLGRPLQ